MSKKPFDKFINKKEAGAKKKERIRQEKKQLRAEKNAYFDEQKRLAREKRKGGASRTNEPAPGGSAFKPQRSVDKRAPGKKFTPSDSKTNTRSDERKAATDRREIKVFAKKGGKSISNQQSAISRQQSAGKSQQSIVKGQPSATAKPAISNQKSEITEMPLNKFIAWSGVCGRREAADIIKAGKVLVNGQIVKEPPHRVSQADNIRVNGKKISIQKNLVYILLNKPKDYITTTDDPEGRKTVMDLVKHATEERVFPVGRLDRNTTGVMLLTNDGELAQRLTHPKYEVKKIYEVRVDQPVTKQQLDTIASGITLEDGFIQPDAVAYADAKDKSVVGIEIHSGRNRIVRRIFEHLGFKVKNLDRVMYGIFTKKNVDRGKWRYLSEKEIRLLKHLNTSFRNKKSSQQGAKK